MLQALAADANDSTVPPPISVRRPAAVDVELVSRLSRSLSYSKQYNVTFMLPLPLATLEVFYAPSCAPCRLELPVLAEFAKDGAQIRILILAEEARARDELRAVSPQLEASAKSPSDLAPGAAVRAAGNRDGILPFARAVSTQGQVCATWFGRLTLERARSLVAACTRFKLSPSSPRF